MQIYVITKNQQLSQHKFHFVWFLWSKTKYF